MEYKSQEDAPFILGLSTEEDENAKPINKEFNEFCRNFVDFMTSIKDEQLNDQIINELIRNLNAMANFIKQDCDITLIDCGPLKFFIQIPFRIIDNEYSLLEKKTYTDPECFSIKNKNGIEFALLQNYLISYTEFMNFFAKNSSDQLCSKLEPTGYIDVLIHILTHSKFSTILLFTINTFMNLLDNKPSIGRFIPYRLHVFIYQIYINIYIYCDDNDLYKIKMVINGVDKIKIFYDLNNPENSVENQINNLTFSIIESLCNFEIFLPNSYKKVYEENQDRGFKQLYSALESLIKLQKDDFVVLKTDFYFSILYKIFYYKEPTLLKHYSTPNLIDNILKYLGPYCNFKYDKQILYILTSIAENKYISAGFILKPQFLQYEPYSFPNCEQDELFKSILVCYCNLWKSIIINIIDPSQLLFRRQNGINKLLSISDSILTITGSILEKQEGDENFDILKATTLIHIALIASNNNEIIRKILEKFPNIDVRIQKLIDEDDPKSIVLIVQAINLLFNFVNSCDANAFPKILTWLHSDDLIQSLSDIQSDISTDDLQQIHLVISKLSKDQSKE